MTDKNKLTFFDKRLSIKEEVRIERDLDASFDRSVPELGPISDFALYVTSTNETKTGRPILIRPASSHNPRGGHPRYLRLLHSQYAFESSSKRKPAYLKKEG